MLLKLSIWLCSVYLQEGAEAEFILRSLRYFVYPSLQKLAKVFPKWVKVYGLPCLVTIPAFLSARFHVFFFCSQKGGISCSCDLSQHKCHWVTSDPFLTEICSHKLSLNKKTKITTMVFLRCEWPHILGLSFLTSTVWNMEVLLKCKSASCFFKSITLNGYNLGFKYCLR